MRFAPGCNCCGHGPCHLGNVLIATDSNYGEWTLTWDESIERWVGCKTLSYPATFAAPPFGPCPASSPAIWIVFGFNATTGIPFLSWQYVSTGTLPVCMPDSSCSDTPNASISAAGPASGWTCEPLFVRFSIAPSVAHPIGSSNIDVTEP